jgi:3-deoxy-manno-octulosonate cytidylyltransferase (CMP-KDO synthetase)
MNIIGIIPARLKSTRLPEKLLIKVKGKTIIEYVYENARRAKLIRKLYVATDSDRIKKALEKSGCSVIMTSKKCKSGSERLRDALRYLKANINDIIINIQGDEPLLEPRLIDAVIAALIKDKRYDMATLASPIKDQDEMHDKGVVKVVTGYDSNALYFSRASIPFERDGAGAKEALKHIGIYAYRKSVLDKWPRLASKYENIEKLEQLRAIENGCMIKVIVAKSKSIGIDTKADLDKFKKTIR